MTQTGCVYIYGLTDTNDQICYVGKSVAPKRRLSTHLHDARSGRAGPKYDWLRELLANNQIPGLLILDKVSSLSWQFHEQYWIAKTRTSNPSLLNIAAGGEGIDSATASAINTGRSLSVESRQKTSDSLKAYYSEHKVASTVGSYKRNTNHVRRIRETTGKISQEDAQTIRTRYLTGETTQNELAKEYALSQSAISRIVNNKLWQRQLPP